MSMVTNLGRATKGQHGWKFVDTSGDLYADASEEQRRYGSTHVLPYSLGKDVNVFWDMVPARAATVISFIRCVSVALSYNGDVEVLLIPGDRSMMVCHGEIAGYNDSVEKKLYLGAHEDEWQYVYSQFYRAHALNDGLKSRVNQDDIWIRILQGLLSGYQLCELTGELQSRLRWELRVRRGA